jgi:hypothetical protein
MLTDRCLLKEFPGKEIITESWEYKNAISKS